MARVIAQWLSERSHQQFIVENRPGGSGNIGTEVVVRAPADGYTLLLASLANAANATLYDKLSFNFIRDVAPIAGIMRVPGVMEVNPMFPARTVPEFIAYAKANPGKVNFASGGSGTPQHVSGELFKLMTGVEMIHIPYRGNAPALTDLLGGQVQVMFDTMPNSIQYIRADKIAAIGGQQLRHAGRDYRKFQLSVISFLAINRAAGMGSPHRRTRLQMSLIGLTTRSMPL